MPYTPPSSMRRSEQHESEIARLADKITRAIDADTSRALEHKDGSESPSVAAKYRRARRSMDAGGDIPAPRVPPASAAEPTYTAPVLREAVSPPSSTPARRRTSSYAQRIAPDTRTTPGHLPRASIESRRSTDGQPDFGDEYLHADLSHRLASTSMQSIARPPQAPRSATAPAQLRRSTSHRSSPTPAPVEPHTRNLRLALEQLERTTDPTSELAQQLGTAVCLAEEVNNGLRQTIRASLEVRMSLALQPAYEPMEGLVDTLDTNLSDLLKYSDDHVRSLTDTLIALGKEERALRRQEAARMMSPPRATVNARDMLPAGSPRYASSVHPSPSPRQSSAAALSQMGDGAMYSRPEPPMRSTPFYAARPTPLSTPSLSRVRRSVSQHDALSTKSPMTPLPLTSPAWRSARAGRLAPPPQTSSTDTDSVDRL